MFDHYFGSKAIHLKIMDKDFNYYSKKFSYYSYQLQIAIDSIGSDIQPNEDDLVSEVYLSLINRIGINITSIHHLSNVFSEENISSSIALLYRSCLSDIFFGYYLLIFKSDVDSFKGEIKLKDAEFLKYARKVSPIEQYLLSDTPEDLDKRRKEFFCILKDRFHDLIENIDSNSDSIESIKIKSVKSIRLEFQSNPDFFDDSFNEAPSENFIFDYLLKLDKQREDYYKRIYSHWRFYSQFQHFTFAGKDFIHDDKKNFLYYFILSLMDCYYFTYILQRDIFHATKEDFNEKIEEVLNLVEEFSRS